MSRLIRKLWSDDNGALLASEFLFMSALLTIGTVTGLVSVRQAMISELVETANSIMALDQSFSFSGQSFAGASTAGSSATDHSNSITVSATAPSNAMINQACD
jgi:predicted lysophospholipase L1 biosynthesis ABC-type transport system permease subunit